MTHKNSFIKLESMSLILVFTETSGFLMVLILVHGTARAHIVRSRKYAKHGGSGGQCNLLVSADFVPSRVIYAMEVCNCR